MYFPNLYCQNALEKCSVTFQYAVVCFFFNTITLLQQIPLHYLATKCSSRNKKMILHR